MTCKLSYNQIDDRQTTALWQYRLMTNLAICLAMSLSMTVRSLCRLEFAATAFTLTIAHFGLLVPDTSSTCELSITFRGPRSTVSDNNHSAKVASPSLR